MTCPVLSTSINWCTRNLRADFPALRSLEGTPNNLTQQLNSFVGRERELAEIKAMLASNRLVTLLGMGGIGKSRLSMQLAAEVLDDFPDGVWFVELAALTDPSLVPQAVASVLGVKEEAGRLGHRCTDQVRARPAACWSFSITANRSCMAAPTWPSACCRQARK